MASGYTRRSRAHTNRLSDISQFDIYDGTADHEIKWRSVEAKVTAIKRSLRKNELYVDHSFPNLSKEKGTMRELLQASLRPKDFRADYLDPAEPWVMYDGDQAAEVLQGEIDDCWLVGGIANVGSRPDLLSRLIVSREYEPKGVYGLLLFYEGKWQEVIIDDRLPGKLNGEPACAHTRSKQLWVSLVEKAVAKLKGSYTKIEGGYSCHGFRMLTSFSSYDLPFSKDNRPLADEKINHATLRANRAFEDSYLVCAEMHAPEEIHWRYKLVGLVPNHAYTAHDIIAIQQCPLIFIRNVWGHTVWNGDWGPDSKLWQTVRRKNIPRQGKGHESNGTFWMSIIDFSKWYRALRMCDARAECFLYTLKSVILCSRDSHWSALQFTVIEDCTVDIALVLVSSDSPDEPRLMALVALFDERDNFIACSKHDYFYQENIILPPAHLPPGRYKAYCISFDSWLHWITTEFSFVLHSTKDVKCKLVREPTESFATVLLKLARHVAEPYIESELRVYRFRKFFSTGTVVVAINISLDKTYQITTNLEFPHGNMKTTRESNSIVDTIPPLHSQILQVVMPINQYELHGFGLSIAPYSLRYTLGRQIEVRTKPPVPYQSLSLHRLIPNDAFMRR